jgi:hypothetical protein
MITTLGTPFVAPAPIAIQQGIATNTAMHQGNAPDVNLEVNALLINCFLGFDDSAHALPLH